MRHALSLNIETLNRKSRGELTGKLTRLDGDMAVTHETFELMDTASKLRVIFDYTRESYRTGMERDKICECRLAECDLRFGKLKKMKKWQTGLAFVGGFVGGFAAHWLEWLKK